MVKKLGNYKGNDIELCRTTNGEVGEAAARELMKNRIPFTRNLRYIPFFKRTGYQGASKVWIITTNPHVYGQARQTIDRMDQVYRERLVVSNF